MSDPATHRFAVDHFLAWQRGQVLRHELVEGQPVARAGAQIRHDRATVNAIPDLGRQVRAGGSGCDVFTADTGTAWSCASLPPWRTCPRSGYGLGWTPCMSGYSRCRDGRASRRSPSGPTEGALAPAARPRY
jgi:hypothetical protein